MAGNTKKKVTLVVDGDDFRFEVGLTEFNAFQNGFVPGLNVVAPSENFLTSCVHKEDADKLIELCDQGLGPDLAGVLSTQYKPQVTISVKN